MFTMVTELAEVRATPTHPFLVPSLTHKNASHGSEY